MPNCTLERMVTDSYSLFARTGQFGTPICPKVSFTTGVVGSLGIFARLPWLHMLESLSLVLNYRWITMPCARCIQVAMVLMQAPRISPAC